MLILTVMTDLKNIQTLLCCGQWQTTVTVPRKNHLLAEVSLKCVVVTLFYFKLLLLLSGDVETNPGPIYNATSSLSVVHKDIGKTNETLLAEFLLLIISSSLLQSGNVERNPGPLEKLLQLKDLAEVRRVAYKARASWEDIGLELGLDPATLECIQFEFRNIKSCFTVMLKHWLRKPPNVVSPTWSMLASALEQPTVDHYRLADEIRKKKLSTETENAVTVDQCSAPQHDCRQLSSEINFALPTSDRGQSMTPVDGPDQHFEIPTVHCTEMELKVVHGEVKHLEKNFSEVTTCTYNVIIKNKVDISAFRANVTALSLSLKREHQQFIDEQLQGCTTLSESWVCLNKYWNFLNYTLLEHIVQTFGCADLKEKMNVYVSDLQKFRISTKLHVFIKYCKTENFPELPEIELHSFVLRKSDLIWETTTLEDVEKLQKTLTNKFFLPACLQFLRDVSDGSLVITWYLPAQTAAVLREDIENMRDKKFFEENQIECISIQGRKCYYSPLRKYAAFLRCVYSSKENKNIEPFKLAQIVKQEVNHKKIDSFTRSSIRGNIDDVFFMKESIAENDIGRIKDTSNRYRKPKLVLIDGAPGVGKTTLSSQVCYKWSQSKILQEYSLLILLPLRDNQVRSSNCIADLLNYSELQQVVAQELQRSQGEGVLFWLEGFDELEEDLRTKSSVFLDLINGKVLPKATIVVTSRPWASKEIVKQLSERTDQHIEIVTTPCKQLDRICREGKIGASSFGQFSEYVDSNEPIFAAMHTPITADITVEVFEWNMKKALPLPCTMTQLYTSFTLKLLAQHLPSNNGSNQFELHGFDDLPHNVYEQFWSLCQLAYDGIVKKQFVFTDLPSEFECLGLMQTVEQFYDENHPQKSYNFIHLTLQEYLSAFFMSQQSTLELFHKHHNSSHFKMVLRFLAGLTRLQYLSPVLSQQLCENDNLTLFHWLFEANDRSVVVSNLTLDRINVRSSYSWTSLDYYVVGYCLSLSNCAWNLDFFRFIDNDGLKMFSRGVLQNSDFECKGYIMNARLGLTSNSISAAGIEWFSKLPNRVFSGLVNLNLSRNKLDEKALTLLSNAIPSMPSLEKLNLSGNPTIGCGGAVILLKSLLTTNTTLRELDFHDTGIGEEDTIIIGELLSRNKSMTKLGITGISSRSVNYILKGLHENNSLEELIVWDSQFTLEAATLLSSVLKQPTCRLQMVNIQGCGIASNSCINLAEGLSNNQSVRTLRLSSNPIGDEGIASLAKMLSQNKHIEELWLSSCNVTSNGAVQLANVLSTENKSLKILCFPGNSIGPEGATALAVMIENNRSLKELWLHIDKSLEEDGVRQLISGLAKNSSFNELRLPLKYKMKVHDDRIRWWQ